MLKIDQTLFDLGRMDTLAMGDSPLHRLDPRAKLLTTLIFIVSVVSFGKYELSAMVPFFIYPLVQIAAGGLPLPYLLRKVMIVAPFAIFIGIFNPMLDREILLSLGTFHISGGWISYLSILMRFALTVLAALTLIALTGFSTVCLALEKLGMPQPFVVQLLFLYRYIFVLTEEAARLVRARSLRVFDSRGLGFKPFISLVGHLLLRTLDRAQRVHLAMHCRGFDGRIPILRPMRFGWPEIRYVVAWAVLFGLMRFYNLPMKLGILMTGLFT
ncbi:MAG: cobalt ECF transporter T component CbiQ [Proteobacteria bacterium]|nr:cobalt ECF transporter T component CbiQ [Pseudomonadota bacterium]MBU4469759.1 cobalt ECF transporter T component CbiQ [Pseudomonadota bacterium]MCG2753861.1 cobalt ECF transporter T component CbiQ [Desulfobacteraceae bacterium]